MKLRTRLEGELVKSIAGNLRQDCGSDIQGNPLLDRGA
jgi:hypothetical protein